MKKDYLIKIGAGPVNGRYNYDYFSCTRKISHAIYLQSKVCRLPNLIKLNNWEKLRERPSLEVYSWVLNQGLSKDSKRGVNSLQFSKIGKRLYNIMKYYLQFSHEKLSQSDESFLYQMEIF